MLYTGLNDVGRLVGHQAFSFLHPAKPARCVYPGRILIFEIHFVLCWEIFAISNHLAARCVFGVVANGFPAASTSG